MKFNNMEKDQLFIMHVVIDLIYMILGSFLISIGTNWFLLPYKMTTGGASGVATIFYYIFNVPMGLTIIFINIPLFIFSIIKLGIKFNLKTIFTTIILALFFEIFKDGVFIKFGGLDMFTSCVFGGIIVGLGLALVFKAGASSGGSDLLAQLIYKLTKAQSVSKVLLIIEFFIISAIIIVFKDINVGLYSIIAMAISTKVVNVVFEGIYYTKVVTIITNKSDKVIPAILNDLKSDKRMNRLVIGDVGSGKTIVAIIATFANFLSGYSTAFMAPTEILAKQHYETIKEYFKYFDINICLLTGSLTKKKKISIYKEIENGKYDVVIGTHALLNENLKFNNLGLVITDEQHRFGVNQRNTLQNKGMNKEADVLYLSATPIPRTYALTIYGDLDLSQIKTKPNIRKEIKTKVVYEQNIKEVLMAMYEELKLNHQIFVVSPLIMQNDELDLNSVIKLKEKLDIAFNKKVRIEILHGKLKQKEKDELMKEFQSGKIKILISTTVIEVGIDVPNATMMVIFNAERFGLATLHQLRGRVGRSNLQSYCYLVTNTKNNERLKVMEESSDGFYISEMDFKQRGQGDLFGIKQSGDMSFKIANLNRDYNILMQTNKDSNEFLTSNNYKENELYTNIVKDIANLD